MVGLERSTDQSEIVDHYQTFSSFFDGRIFGYFEVILIIFSTFLSLMELVIPQMHLSV